MWILAPLFLYLLVTMNLLQNVDLSLKHNCILEKLYILLTQLDPLIIQFSILRFDIYFLFHFQYLWYYCG